MSNWTSLSKAVAGCLIALALLVQCSHPPSEIAAPVAESEVDAASDAKPNVVLVVIDALRADRLTAQRNGIALMPRLAEFAADSWWFTCASTQSTWTKPSMVSLFTSLYPGVHNVQFGASHRIAEGQEMSVDILPETLDTMAECFKRAGYETAAMQANANVKGAFGFKQGFPDYSYRFDAYPEFRAREITQAAMAHFESAKGPLFLYLHYMEPHAPYDPPVEYLDRFEPLPPVSPEERRQIDSQYFDYYGDKVQHDLGLREERKFADWTEAGREYVRVKYDAEVRYADEEVGRLLAFIRESRPNTVVVVLADHGEELWEHGSVGHGRTLYQELLAVPLIMSFPGEKARRIEAPVELIDVLPTLAARVHLEKSELWQGRDLASPLPAARPVFAQTMTSLREADVHLEAVLQGDDKLIADMRRQNELLFRLLRDPTEHTPVKEDAREAQLKTLLTAHDAENEHHPAYTPPGSAARLDQESIEQLKSQGYL